MHLYYVIISLVLLVGCELKKSTSTVATKAPSLSCDEILGSQNKLREKFVNQTTKLSCLAKDDCVYAPTDAMCAELVNQAAAKGYKDYLASSDYVDLKTKFANTNCPQEPSNCSGEGPFDCINKECQQVEISKVLSTCEDLEKARLAALASAVDQQTQFKCSVDSDCVWAPKVSVCGSYVNKDAAQKYAAFLATTTYLDLQTKRKTLKCREATNDCARTGSGSCSADKCTWRYN